MTIKVVVPVSGGKDSQTCLSLAVEYFGSGNVLGLFCDTKFEHPITYRHIDTMKSLYEVDIVTVSGGSVEEKILKYKRFPGGGARFCTDELKIREAKIFYREFAKVNGSFEVWYGMRSDESSERKKRYSNKISDELYTPNEVMSKYPKYLHRKYGVMFRLPILDWSAEQVYAYLGGLENPLYQWFDRVGCFPCLAAGDKYKSEAFNYDDFGREQYQKMLHLKDIINKPIFRNESKYSGCAICSI